MKIDSNKKKKCIKNIWEISEIKLFFIALYDITKCWFTNSLTLILSHGPFTSESASALWMFYYYLFVIMFSWKLQLFCLIVYCIFKLEEHLFNLILRIKQMFKLKATVHMFVLKNELIVLKNVIINSWKSGSLVNQHYSAVYADDSKILFYKLLGSFSCSC